MPDQNPMVESLLQQKRDLDQNLAVLDNILSAPQAKDDKQNQKQQKDHDLMEKQKEAAQQLSEVLQERIENLLQPA